MSKRSLSLRIMCAGLFAVLSPKALAAWSWNLGYQNPHIATYGLNLLFVGKPFAVEIGLGWVDGQTLDTDPKDSEGGQNGDQSGDEDTANVQVAGDIDIKYYFSGDSVKPFLQAGLGYGVGASAGKKTDIGLSAGSGFGGAGLMVDAKAFYLYGSYNVNSHQRTFVQGGLGFPL